MADQLVGCPPLPVIFTPTIDSSGEYDYAWSFNRFSNDVFKGFTPPEFIEFDNNTDSVVVYPVTFTSYNQCGESSQNLLVSVSPLPLARIGIDSIKTGCSPFEVILTNRSSGNPDSCFWSITDGFTLPSLQDTIHRVFHAADTSIEYFVTLNAINECGVSKAFDTITVIPPGVSAFYNLEEYLVCAYESVKFEDASTPFPTNWLWNFGDGFFSTEPNPVHVFNTPNDTFQVLLTVSTGCGSDNIVRTVITLPAPIVDFDLPPYGCQGQPVEGIKNFSEPNSLYLWEYNKGEQGENIYEPMPVFIDGGVTVSVKLTVTDFLNGCFNFLEKPLYIRNRPKADFALSDSSGCQVLNGETINLSKDANTWLWRLNDRDLAASENIGYSFRDLGKQDIQLIASWDEVCMDSLTKTVTVVECGVYVPSAFSPNNDGTNDFFTIYGTPTVRRVKSFKVFSRRGDMVFERYDFPANVETKGWDGTLDGKYMNPAVFVWIADVEFVDGTVGRFKGDVTLVK
jgi:gliding motility-associated-like protein